MIYRRSRGIPHWSIASECLALRWAPSPPLPSVTADPMVRLDRVTLREIRLALKEPFRISSGVESERRILLLELSDADGVSTWAECVAFPRPNYTPETIDTAWLAIREWLAPRLLGRDLEPT